VYERINDWRQRPEDGDYPYIYLDGIYLKRCWISEARNVSILVCIGMNNDGFRDVLSVMEGAREDYDCRLAFLRHLKERMWKRRALDSASRNPQPLDSENQTPLSNILFSISGTTQIQMCEKFLTLPRLKLKSKSCIYLILVHDDRKFLLMACLG
jgi:hypothetical protein